MLIEVLNRAVIVLSAVCASESWGTIEEFGNNNKGDF